MSTGNYFDLTSEAQPIAVKMRPGLTIQKVSYQSEPWWIVKDPHDQQYHQYNEQEFAILSWLDGEISFLELREKFERRFSPFRVSYRELIGMIREFFKKSVIVSTSGGNGQQLHDFSRRKRREKLQQKLKNVLAVQFRGWDPTRFIDATWPFVRWFFSRTAVRINLLFALSAICWLLFHHDEFSARLPNLWSLLDGDNLLVLGLTICVTKVFHELGHGYAHRRFGGECHELGVMVFFLMPTLYCNTSDSWMLSDKWKRMAIGAAGVYVELVIFAVATFVWWFSAVGIVQDISLNLMVICSISAALTNGNPLMRYDGYFVLSDWLEIPNLAKRSGKEIRRRFLNQCLGIEREIDHWTSQSNQRIFIVYGIAAFVYRVLLISVIGYWIIQRFQTIGLASLGLVIAGSSFLSLFTQPVKTMFEYFKEPGNAQHVRRKPLQITVSIGVICLLIVLFVPLPFYVPAECSVELCDRQTVYASADGRIAAIHVRPGEAVQAGQSLVELANEELQERIVDMQSQLDEINLRLKYQTIPRDVPITYKSTSESARTLSMTRQKLISQLAVLRKKEEGLHVRASRSGHVFGLTIGERKAETDDDHLNRIHGNPLSDSNLGGWLERGDEICRIGDQRQCEVVMLIEQKENGLIAPGQPVTVLLSSLSSERLHGHIKTVSLKENHQRDLPSPIYEESSAPMIAQIKQDSQADKRKDINFKDGRTLESTMLQATVALDPTKSEESTHLNFASVGKVRIFVGRHTLLWRIRRTVGEVFQRSI